MKSKQFYKHREIKTTDQLNNTFMDKLKANITLGRPIKMRQQQNTFFMIYFLNAILKLLSHTDDGISRLKLDGDNTLGFA